MKGMQTVAYPEGPSTQYLRTLAPTNHTLNAIWDQGPQKMGTWTLWVRLILSLWALKGAPLVPGGLLNRGLLSTIWYYSIPYHTVLYILDSLDTVYYILYATYCKSHHSPLWGLCEASALRSPHVRGDDLKLPELQALSSSTGDEAGSRLHCIHIYICIYTS